jgi:hypothetical protein
VDGHNIRHYQLRRSNVQLRQSRSLSAPWKSSRLAFIVPGPRFISHLSCLQSFSARKQPPNKAATLPEPLARSFLRLRTLQQTPRNSTSHHVFLDYGPTHYKRDRGSAAWYAFQCLAHAYSLTAGIENNYESTFLEPPETPAHQFAVNAFKHALFGTPAPEDANNPTKRADKIAKLDALNAKNIVFPAPTEEGGPLSPSKQPGGILMTPGTASRGRKTVSFGSQVVDNEGKRGNIGRSGIPNDCPGKFPSPWTPGTELKLEPGSDKRPRTKLTEALLDARTTTQPKSGQKPKAKDDSDITIDMGAPRSESGKYWKEQYENYAERSEKEMRKVIAKQQLAKKFAMKKDGEVTELTTKFEQERKKFRQRERELEQQNKDFQERLRQAMADNSSSAIEIAALKGRIATLEQTAATPSSESTQSKPSFQIFEDVGKEAVKSAPRQDRDLEVSFAPSMASSGKENYSPKPRHDRRQSASEASARPSAPTRLGTGEGEASIILGKSPRPFAPSVEIPREATFAPLRSEPEQRPRSPLRTRKIEPTKENTSSRSPDAVLPSSPLPMPSPGIDPWMDLNNDSTIPQMDKMAIPSYSGKPFSRPEWEPAPKQRHASKPAPQTKSSASSRLETRKAEMNAASREKRDVTSSRSQTLKATRAIDAQSSATIVNERHYQSETKRSSDGVPAKADAMAHHSPTDAKFDLSKITAHYAEGSTQVTKDRVEIGPEARKAKAKKRLEEKQRERLRKNAPA